MEPKPSGCWPIRQSESLGLHDRASGTDGDGRRNAVLPTGMATGANGFAPNVAGYQGMFFLSHRRAAQSNHFSRPIRRRTRASTASPRICNARHPNGSTPTHGYANLPTCNAYGRPVRRRSPTTTNDADARHGDPTRLSASASVRNATSAADDGNADDGSGSASSSGFRRVADAAEMMNWAAKEKKIVPAFADMYTRYHCCRVKATFQAWP